MAKKKKYTPQAYNIEVDVDAKGNFTYSVNGNAGGNTVRPRNSDTISWAVRVGGIPHAFQIEFADFSPFGFTNKVIRSAFGPTPPMTVAIPSFYHGNLVLKYTVSVGNGWSDDPDVEPVLSDGFHGQLDRYSIKLSIDGGTLVLDQPDASFGKGQLSWNWLGTPQDNFTLVFTDPPADWPAVKQGPAQRIALDLESPGTEVEYTIQTMNLGLSVQGKLTIS